MARPRLRPYFLAVGAGLAAAYASVSDFTGVIHSYYSDNSNAGAPTPVPTPVCDFADAGAGLAGCVRTRWTVMNDHAAPSARTGVDG